MSENRHNDFSCPACGEELTEVICTKSFQKGRRLGLKEGAKQELERLQKELISSKYMSEEDRMRRIEKWYLPKRLKELKELV